MSRASIAKGAADYPEARAVGLDGGVARSGEIPDKAVVGADPVRSGIALCGGEEQQPELIAGAESVGDQAPVQGNLLRTLRRGAGRRGAGDLSLCPCVGGSGTHQRLRPASQPGQAGQGGRQMPRGPRQPGPAPRGTGRANVPVPVPLEKIPASFLTESTFMSSPPLGWSCGPVERTLLF